MLYSFLIVHLIAQYPLRRGSFSNPIGVAGSWAEFGSHSGWNAEKSRFIFLKVGAPYDSACQFDNEHGYPRIGNGFLQ